VPVGRSCLRRLTPVARSPRAIVVGPQSAAVSESENTILGISFIGWANGPAAPRQNPAPRAEGAAPMRGGRGLLPVSSGQRAPAAERPAATQSLLPSTAGM